jgi:hypothetical protein
VPKNLRQLLPQDTRPTARMSHRCKQNAPPEDTQRRAHLRIVGTIRSCRQVHSTPSPLPCRQGPEALLAMKEPSRAGMPMLLAMTISAS